MKRSLLFTALSCVLLVGCSEEQSAQEKEFIKACHYSSNTRISKSECSCIYKDLLNKTYSEEDMSNILTDNYPVEQLIQVKNDFTKNLFKSYQQCK